MTSRLYRDSGVVLRTFRLGEADRIIVFLTMEHGKVRAVAKGIRKTRSKFGGRLEPLCHVNVQLHRGRELDVVSQVESIDAASSVFGDLDAMTDAGAILEAVDLLVPDREPVPEIYRMLVGVRQTLMERPSPLVMPAFLWKLLAFEGVRPTLDRCVRCDVELEVSDVSGLDLDQGGVCCRACRGGVAVSVAALTILRDIVGGRLGPVLEVAHLRHSERQGDGEPDPVSNEVATLATKAFEHHIERRLRSASLFERR
jgi:DNA repair protein RecO (recombination protein O)